MAFDALPAPLREAVRETRFEYDCDHLLRVYHTYLRNHACGPEAAGRYLAKRLRAADTRQAARLEGQTMNGQTAVGDAVMRKMADAIGRYCEADEATRSAVRSNLRPYLAEGVSVEVTCPGARRRP